MRAIVYCCKCGTRLLSRDFTSNTAFSIFDKSYCLACTMSILRSLPSDVQDAILHQLMDEPMVKTPLPRRFRYC